MSGSEGPIAPLSPRERTEIALAPYLVGKTRVDNPRPGIFSTTLRISPIIPTKDTGALNQFMDGLLTDLPQELLSRQPITTASYDHLDTQTHGECLDLPRIALTFPTATRSRHVETIETVEIHDAGALAPDSPLRRENGRRITESTTPQVVEQITTRIRVIAYPSRALAELYGKYERLTATEKKRLLKKAPDKVRALDLLEFSLESDLLRRWQAGENLAAYYFSDL